MKIKSNLLVVVLIILLLISMIRVPVYALDTDYNITASTSNIIDSRQEYEYSSNDAKEMLWKIQGLVVFAGLLLMIVGLIEFLKYRKKDDNSNQLSDDELASKRNLALKKITFSVYILIFAVVGTNIIGILLFR